MPLTPYAVHASKDCDEDGSVALKIALSASIVEIEKCLHT